MNLSGPEPELADAFAAAASGWRPLTRSRERLAFPLPGRFVMPGGFFRWFFYWDSCFMIPGLLISGERTLARGIVDNLVVSIEEFGLVPNYNGPKGVCASRSQPPFLTWAITEVWPTLGEPAWLERAVAAAVSEYETYWTSEPHLTELGLSRYIDRGGEGCGTVPDTPHHRAIAESGWDNTTRFGDDATRVVPVDLNAQLYRYEVDLAGFFRILDRPDEAADWERRARDRRELIARWLWDEELGIYRFRHNDRRSVPTPRPVPVSAQPWSLRATWTGSSSCWAQLSVTATASGLATTGAWWGCGGGRPALDPLSGAGRMERGQGVADGGR